MMTKRKANDHPSGGDDGVVKPTIRWFDGSMHLDIGKVVSSVPFRDKLDKVELLEKRLQDDN